MKKLIAMTLAVLMVLAMTVPALAADDVTVIKLGHACGPNHPYSQGAEKFAEVLAEKTDGRFSVEIYPESTLGAERDLIEGLQMGSVEMCIVSTAPLSSYSDALLAFDLPYIFTSTEQARGVCDSEIGRAMLDELPANGIVGLCFFENGFRHFTNSTRPIVEPADVAGLKIRVMENQVMMRTIEVLGGSPTPMAFNELYTALQQGTIDGEENPVSQIYDKKMYEVQKYMSMSGHFYAPAPLLISSILWDTLSEEDQAIFMEAAEAGRDYMRERNEIEEQDQIDYMVEQGVEICYDVDVDAFVEAVQPVYDEFVGRLIDADVVEAIQNFEA